MLADTRGTGGIGVSGRASGVSPDEGDSPSTMNTRNGIIQDELETARAKLALANEVEERLKKAVEAADSREVSKACRISVIYCVSRRVC